MKPRRLFLKDICNITLLSGLYVAKPSVDFINFMSGIEKSYTPHEFDAWEDEFQTMYKDRKHELDLTLQGMLRQKTGSSSNMFLQGESKSGVSAPLKTHAQKTSYTKSVKFKTTKQEDVDAAYDYFSNVPVLMSSPYGNVHTQQDRAGNTIWGNQCFRATNYGKEHLVMFVKTDSTISKEVNDEFLIVHPKFNFVIGNQRYFCYGVPAEMPTISRCSNCKKFYYSQIFCYKAKDPDYGVKPVYTQFINDPYCEYKDEHNYKLHEGVSNISELVPCKCYDDLIPLVINSGNLDKK